MWREIYYLRHSAMSKGGSGGAVGLETGSLVSTLVGLISLQRTFTAAQRSTACVLHLTHQKPFPSAFFLSFPPALYFLLPFFPPSILPCHLPTGKLSAASRCPTFFTPSGNLPPQQPSFLTSEAARAQQEAFEAHGAPDGAGTKRWMKNWGNNEKKKCLPS